MKKIGLILFISIFCLAADLPKSAHKKIDKTLSALWEGQEVRRGTLKELEDIKVSEIKVNDTFVGYYTLAKANSKADFFDFMVVYTPDLKIMSVQLLVYREDYGGEIGSKRWLKQFKGVARTEDMKFGHDIQNISGATISARNITSGIQKTTIQMNYLKNQGKI